MSYLIAIRYKSYSSFQVVNRLSDVRSTEQRSREKKKRRKILSWHVRKRVKFIFIRSW